MEEMILVNNLRKEFTYYKKGAGGKDAGSADTDK